jgi:hypothetical protein
MNRVKAVIAVEPTEYHARHKMPARFAMAQILA